MGANNSTRRVSFESDENENITVVKGIRLSESVINRMREPSATLKQQGAAAPPSAPSPPVPPPPLLQPVPPLFDHITSLPSASSFVDPVEIPAPPPPAPPAVETVVAAPAPAPPPPPPPSPPPQPEQVAAPTVIDMVLPSSSPIPAVAAADAAPCLEPLVAAPSPAAPAAPAAAEPVALSTPSPPAPVEPLIAAPSPSPALVEMVASLAPPLPPPPPPPVIEPPPSPPLMEPLAPSQIIEPLAPSQIIEPLAPLQLIEPLAPSQVIEPLAPSQIIEPLAPLSVAEAVPPLPPATEPHIAGQLSQPEHLSSPPVFEPVTILQPLPDPSGDTLSKQHAEHCAPPPLPEYTAPCEPLAPPPQPSVERVSSDPPAPEPVAVPESTVPPPVPAVDEEALRKKITDELHKELELERARAEQDLQAWFDSEKARVSVQSEAETKRHVQEEVSKILSAERAAAQESLQQAVIRERIATEDEKLRAQILEIGRKARQLEAREADLNKQDTFYREQVARLEEKSAHFYKVTTENYHKAADEVNGKFKRYEVHPVCADLQGRILECYRGNVGKTLHCSNIAALYMQCVNNAKQNKMRTGG